MKWYFVCAGAFAFGAGFGYSRLLREWHTLIMVSTLLSWFTGLLLVDRVNHLAAGQSVMAEWLGASYAFGLVTVPCAITGWGIVYFWREVIAVKKRR